MRDPRLAEYERLTGRQVFRAVDSAPITAAGQGLWAWWQRSTAGNPGRAADRAAFDIVEHPGLAAHLYLVDRVEGGFRLRLQGEIFTEMFQRPKHYEWRAAAPDPMNHAFAIYFGFVLGAREPYRNAGRLKSDTSGWFSFESLLCPLRNGGQDQLLGVVAQIAG